MKRIIAMLVLVTLGACLSSKDLENKIETANLIMLLRVIKEHQEKTAACEVTITMPAPVITAEPQELESITLNMCVGE